MDIQTNTECTGRYCVTTWALKVGLQPERNGFTIRKPNGDVRRIPVYVVEQCDAEVESVEDIVEETTVDDSSVRRL